MRRVRTIGFVIIGAALGFPGHADLSSTAEFLNFPVGARAVSLGDAVTASPDDAATLFLNPAGLTRLAPYSAVLGRTPYLDSSAHDYWAVSYKGGPRGSWGLGMTSFSAGDIQTFDRSGFALGSTSPADWQGVLGYGRSLPGPAWLAGYSVGGAVKYVSSSLIHTAHSYSGDLGLLSPGYGKGRWGWGMSVTNVAGSLTYDKVSEPLPRMVRWGMAWRARPSLVATADISRLRGESPFLALGSEYHWSLRNQSSLVFRGGFNGRQGEEAAGDGVNVGMGFAWSGWRFDYTYRGLTLEEPTQAITLSVAFNPKGRVLPAPVQKLVDEGNRLVEEGQYPEAVLVFDQALGLSSDCREAEEGLLRAHRLMSGQ